TVSLRAVLPAPGGRPRGADLDALRRRRRAPADRVDADGLGLHRLEPEDHRLDRDERRDRLGHLEQYGPEQLVAERSRDARLGRLRRDDRDALRLGRRTTTASSAIGAGVIRQRTYEHTTIGALYGRFLRAFILRPCTASPGIYYAGGFKVG